MHYSALLFDLDGTLIETIALYERAVIAAFKEIGLTITAERFRDDYMEGKHLLEILKEFGLDETHVPTLREHRDRLYEELLRTEVQWLPGAKETLDRLKGTIPMAIVTGSWMSYLDAISQCLDIKSYTDVIVTADEIHKFMKPHPHGLLLAADRLGVDPKECVYIGDQEFDVEASTRAGMPCVLVKGTYTPKGAEKNAAAVVSSFAELDAALKKINR